MGYVIEYWYEQRKEWVPWLTRDWNYPGFDKDSAKRELEALRTGCDELQWRIRNL